MMLMRTSLLLLAFSVAASQAAETGSHGHEHGKCDHEHCKKAFQTVLMAHDTCMDEQLPKTLENKLHFYEEGCEENWCNTATEAFDPMAVKCESHDEHEHEHEHEKEPCGCVAKEPGFTIKCDTAKTTVTAAVKYLQDNVCEVKKNDTACQKNFAILNAHHDHCDHDDLPQTAELAIHSYEDKFTSCSIKRQFNPKVALCPAVNCTKMDAMNEALKELDEECKPAAPTPAKDHDHDHDHDHSPTTAPKKETAVTTATTKSAASSPSYVVAGFAFLSFVTAYVM